MTWQGPIKPINVDLPEDLHLAVRSEAPRRKLTTKAAYLVALEEWLGKGAAESANQTAEPLTNIRSHEKAFLSPLLEMFRAGDPRLKYIQNHIDEFQYEQKQLAQKKGHTKPEEAKWKKGSRHAV